jgi:hypothetical protein
MLILCTRSTPNVATGDDGWVRISNHVVSNTGTRTTNAISGSVVDYVNNYVKPGKRNPDPVKYGQTAVWQGSKKIVSIWISIGIFC